MNSSFVSQKLNHDRELRLLNAPFPAWVQKVLKWRKRATVLFNRLHKQILPKQHNPPDSKPVFFVAQE
jgi:hypothetical protein